MSELPQEDHPTHARDSWRGLFGGAALLLAGWAASSYFPGFTRFRFADWGAGEWAVLLLFVAAIVYTNMWIRWRQRACVCPRCSGTLRLVYSDDRFAFFPCEACRVMWRSTFRRKRTDDQ
jgi:hypothetical protein